MGDANWWLPRWLDRALPHIDVEGASVIDALEVPVPDDASELDDDRDLVGV
jgi:putative drug exporter of the RND superfamily